MKPMSTPHAASPLTVYLGSKTAMYTFPGGRDVTIGRGKDCDIRIESDKAISRVHAVLRPEGEQWRVVDNSRNGIFVDGARVRDAVIVDDLGVTLGGDDGPRLTFQVNTQRIQPRPVASPAPPAPFPPMSRSGPGGQNPPGPPRVGPPAPPPPGPPPLPPRPTRRPVAPPQRSAPQRLSAPPPARPPQPGPIVHHRPPGPESVRAQPPSAVPPPPAPRPAPRPADPDDHDGAVGRMTGAVRKALSPKVPVGGVVVGRGSGSGIVVEDPLASRDHAVLTATPTGTTITDHGSNNGTFVNGTRITTTTLHPGDVVTIGNTDLHFTGTTLTPAPTDTHTGGLHAAALRQVADGHTLLTDVSFTATPGTVTAVIGPSGAGKSTLIKLLAGATHPSAGWVSFDGHDVHAEYASLRSRIGMVPQDDVVHRQLTVSRALHYAAELRLPPDTTRADRAAVVTRVVDELDLRDHLHTRVDKLSGGQRKRVSVAMELLTGPSLLILDEPTSGLDPALDRQVMSMLRGLADAGRVVIVVTHSLTYLHMCDQVLLLAPGGKTAYAGPPTHIATTMGTTDWADIFAYVSTQPDHAHQQFLHANPQLAHQGTAPEPAGPPGEPARTSTVKQVSTLARRQLRLIVSDRGYFLFLAVLPFVLGALSLVVPGQVGLGQADARGRDPNEPTQLLILLNIATVFMGTALSIRDLVGERAIFRREQSVGLSAAAYLTAKTCVYATAAALQTAILTAIVVTGKGRPTQGALVFGNPVADLYAGLALTAIVSAIVGLALSSVARTTEQILPMLVVVIMLSIVFSGGMIPVTGRIGLEQASWFLPARWGFAATASTVDLQTVAPLLTVDDPLWRHQLRWWLLDVGMLALIGVAALGVLRWRLRLPRAESAEGGRRTGASTAASPADTDARSSSPRRRGGLPRWVVGGCALLAVAGVVAGLSVLTRGGGSRDPVADSPFGDMPTQGTAPPQQPVAAGALAGLLLAPADVAAVMQTGAMTATTPAPVTVASTLTATPPQCAEIVDAGNATGYGSAATTGFAGQTVVDGADARTTVTQYVIGFATMDEAALFQDGQNNAWRDCASATVTLNEGAAPRPFGVSEVTSHDGRLTVMLTDGDHTCQRSLSTDSNVVVDVRACTTKAGTPAEDVATKIADRIS